MKRNILCAVLAALGLGFLLTPAPAKAQKSEQTKLHVFHAGSLSVPFKQIADAFEKENPQYKVLRETSGSTAGARKITELGKEFDIFASADYKIIDELLIPDHASWNIPFAANEMVIAYTKHSRKHNEINADNWYKILNSEGVEFGRSDPDADPCGYRSVLTMKLAEKLYNHENLATEMIDRSAHNVRPKETDLLALLETGTIDYMFIYRSVAKQHGLEFVSLPEKVNLKSKEMADHYSQVSIKVVGKKPGSFMVRKGAPMVYGVTIPAKAPHKEGAMAFMQFLLNAEKGMKIMVDNGQPSLVPAKTSSYDAIPAELKPFASKP